MAEKPIQSDQPNVSIPAQIEGAVNTIDRIFGSLFGVVEQQFDASPEDVNLKDLEARATVVQLISSKLTRIEDLCGDLRGRADVLEKRNQEALAEHDRRIQQLMGADASSVTSESSGDAADESGGSNKAEGSGVDGCDSSEHTSAWRGHRATVESVGAPGGIAMRSKSGKGRAAPTLTPSRKMVVSNSLGTKRMVPVGDMAITAWVLPPGVVTPQNSRATLATICKSHPGDLYYVPEMDIFAVKVGLVLLTGNIGNIAPYPEDPKKKPFRVTDCVAYNQNAAPGERVCLKATCGHYHSPLDFPGSRNTRNYLVRNFIYRPTVDDSPNLRSPPAIRFA